MYITSKTIKRRRVKSLIEIGELCFLVGIFFLATAPFISLIFLLPSLIIGTFKREDKYLKDKWNYPFILVSLLMILSCIINYQQINNFEYEKNSTFISLLNWIPFFWCFWGFQPYLKTTEKRKRCLLLILSGSFPVILTGLGQYFFKWYGPFSFLNGLVIWFQRPTISGAEGLTGLFNNQNYAGTWLSMIFYISLGFFCFRETGKEKRIFALILTFLLGITTFLTYSRNAILSLIIGVAFFLRSKKLLIFIFLLISSALLFTFLSSQISACHNFDKQTYLESENIFVFQKLTEFTKKIIPHGLFVKIQNLLLHDGFKSSPRFIIWDETIKLISERKLFGWGGGSFPALFNEKNLIYFRVQHTHNLPLELAFNYGIPSALIIITSLLFLTFKNFAIHFKLKNNLKFTKENLFDATWITTISIFLFSHIFDVTYYDARISVLAWILFSGMRNMLKENKKDIVF